MLKDEMKMLTEYSKIQLKKIFFQWDKLSEEIADHWHVNLPDNILNWRIKDDHFGMMIKLCLGYWGRRLRSAVAGWLAGQMGVICEAWRFWRLVHKAYTWNQPESAIFSSSLKNSSRILIGWPRSAITLNGEYKSTFPCGQLCFFFCRDSLHSSNGRLFPTFNCSLNWARFLFLSLIYMKLHYLLCLFCPILLQDKKNV